MNRKFSGNTFIEYLRMGFGRGVSARYSLSIGDNFRWIYVGRVPKLTPNLNAREYWESL